MTIDSFIAERYASFDEGIGKDIISGKATLGSLGEYALAKEKQKTCPQADGRSIWRAWLIRFCLVETVFSMIETPDLFMRLKRSGVLYAVC